MHIIPVIDLQAGLAVAARRGRRSQYQPLATPLCADGSVINLAAAYRRLYGLRTLYIADLDAIEGRDDNAQTISDVVAAWPKTDIWCDCGMVAADIQQSVSRHLDTGALVKDTRMVLGSESQDDWRLLRRLAASFPADFILSLDFCDRQFRGPSQLQEDPSCWPDCLIVMTLDRVGSAEGPDLKRLKAILKHAGGRRIYAAGGIRNMRDIENLAAIGVSGALVSTALHHGKVSPADMAALQSSYTRLKGGGSLNKASPK